MKTIEATMRKRIYISLPISGRPMEKARHEADLIKGMLGRMGYEGVSPFEIYAGKDPTWKDHMAADLRALMDCDGIYMAPGWGLSLGCDIELQTVRLMNHHAERYGFKKKIIIYGRA